MRKYFNLYTLLTLAGMSILLTANLHAAIYYPIYSPYPDQATASQLLTRPLIIQTKVMDEKEKQKLMKNDPESVEFQEAYNAYYQQALKYFFDNKFIGSKEILLLSPSGIDSLIASGTSKYAILRGGHLQRNFVVGGKNMSKDTYSFTMTFSEEPTARLIISFTEETLTNTDFLFLVQQVNEILKNASEGGKSPDYASLNKGFQEEMQDKKLLIPESMLTEKLTKEDIQKVYKLPVEYVTNEEYENKVLSESKDYVYLTGSFASSLQGYVCFVVSSESGKVLLALGAGGVTFYVASRPSKEQMRGKGYSNASLSDRNKFSVDLFSIKPRFSVKQSHFDKMMKLAVKK